MALGRGIYRALEDIVGPENISDEPAILDSYAYQWLGEFRPAGKGERFLFRPEAVVLPGGTEEVQAIVKTCNRYKIKFKALSTGWGFFGGPGSEGVIQLDLRRMNRILEIDERNMYAVVEPYVITAQLQAELMQRGLNCQTITAGSNCSALPLSASGGDGYSSVSTSMHPRNILGVEWVSPTGEIVRLGSLGAGAGWFCGDGPGPSLRGIIRGLSSVVGGMGVFTKAATKVYHWSGPPVPLIEGISPSYKIKPLPEMHAYYPVFPSWEKLAEAGIKIAESEIAHILAGLQQYILAADIATSNEESAQLYSEILKSSKGLSGLLVIISAGSKREFDYKERVLREILAETEGEECLPLLEESDIQGGLTWRFTRVSGGSRHGFRCSGASITCCAGFMNWHRLPDIRGGESNKVRNDYRSKGLILDDGIDGGLSISIEFGHFGMSGLHAFFDYTDPEARQAAMQMGMEANKLGLEKYKSIPIGVPNHDILGPLASNYHLWLRKIKKAFDPNVASDPSSYITP